MAASPTTPNSNPIILEPASPSSTLESPSYPSLVTSSSEGSSSSDLFDSPRPRSQNGSQTSQSEPPSPLEAQDGSTSTIAPQDGIELSTLPASTLAPPILTVTPPAPQPEGRDDPPRSVPQLSPTNISTSSQQSTRSASTWVSWLPKKIHERRWLENTICVLGVAVAIWLGVRGYKLAVWQS